MVFKEMNQCYVLKGFIVHISFAQKAANLTEDSANIGHYIAYVEDQGNWFEVDDHRVRQLCQAEMSETSK